MDAADSGEAPRGRLYNERVPPADRPRAALRPTPEHQEALRTLLRGGTPSATVDEATAAAILRRYECGGWLHARRSAPGAAPLPEPWRTTAARAHRKTVVDSLAALGVLREVAAICGDAGVRLIVLKGAAYLEELYGDPGERVLTDIDLLVRPADAGRAAECLLAAGFAVVTGLFSPDVDETRRFEMARPGPVPLHVEIHWRLGSRGRVRFDQDGLWERSRPATVHGAALRRLGTEDAILFHAWHAADSYFGPTLKWALDLRAMFDAWRPQPASLFAGAVAAGARVPLHLLLRQVESLFPGSMPSDLIERTRPGAVRRLALSGWLREEPLEFFSQSPDGGARPFLRPFLIDSPSDALASGLAVLRRPWSRRQGPPPARPWEAAEGR